MKAIDAKSSVAWGEAVDGLQCRLRLEPASCNTSETVYANLEIRNTGTRKMSFVRAPEYFLFDVDGETFVHPIGLGTVGVKPLGSGENVQYKVPINVFKSKAAGERVYGFQPGRHAVKVQLTVYPKDGEPGGPVKITSNTARLEVRAAAATVVGTVIGIDGKPGAEYRVTALPRAWSSMWGMMSTTTTDENGAFSFDKLPEGPCDVVVTSTSLANQPNIRIEGVVLLEEEPVHVELSLEQKSRFSGRVTDPQGQPQSERDVLAIWNDPAGKNRYSSNTKTGSDGRFQFAVPFSEADKILVNDMGNGPELENIKSGRDDIDLTIGRMDDKSATDADIEQRVALLRKDPDQFAFSLHYLGKDDEPYPSLLLEGPATPPRGPLAVGWTGARMSREQVLKLIEHLKADGFLRNARNNGSTERLKSTRRPAYRLTMSSPGDFSLSEVLDWDLRMLRRLDGMSAVLAGDAAQKMKKVISHLDLLRKEWETVSVGRGRDPRQSTS